MDDFPVLTSLALLPLLGSVVVAAVPRGDPAAVALPADLRRERLALGVEGEAAAAEPRVLEPDPGEMHEVRGEVELGHAVEGDDPLVDVVIVGAELDQRAAVQ